MAALGALAMGPIGAVDAAPDGTTYTLFESGPTRPLALSADGKTLAAVNTPDNRVELFAIGAEGRLIPRGSVPVGYEPVALAFRGPDELWVVNHVSDSVSVVALDRQALLFGGRPVGHVVRTLLVGDEPYDIVFAGPNRRRAFISSARRGQNVTRAVLGELGVDPALTTPGLGRAIVWVFDTDGDPASMGGVPLTRIELFTDSPRALAVSPDGSRVYAAGFRTGNRTASVAAQVRRWTGYQHSVSIAGHVQEAMSHIVRSVNGRWVDFLGYDYTDNINFELPDEDVFTIDASAPIPRQIDAPWRGVGTILYAMTTHPITGELYVAHTDARNFAGRETEVRCDFARNRLSILSSRGRVWPRELNTHLDFSNPCDVALGARDLSLALPSGVAFAPDGATLYVTAMGSDAVAFIDTATLIAGEHRPRRADIVRLTGGGPIGVVRHPTQGAIYVATRFDDGISVVSTSHRREIQHVTMHSPEPIEVTRGRRFLYDARATSANGTGACATCHVFGHVDALGWDLGNVHAEVLPTLVEVSIPASARGPSPFFDLMNTIYEHQQLKGAMVTQSLRGLDNHGPMHWRGDRYDRRLLDPALRWPTVQPDLGLFDERAAFDSFNDTFDTLHGVPGGIDEADMRAFTEYAMRLTYPPNAIRNLDDSLTPAQQRGRDLYFDAERPADAIGTCNSCHVLDPEGNAQHGVARPGFYGTDGRMAFDALPQMFKVPHLRNLYDKVGMFGTSRMAFLQEDSLFVDAAGNPIEAFADLGAQVRGFGFVHDGTLDGVRRYLTAVPFAHGPTKDDERPFVGDVPFVGVHEDDRSDLEAFVHAYPGNLAPVVGQQITLDDATLEAGAQRLLMFVDQHAAARCDLVAHRRLDGESVGYLYLGGGRVLDDRGREDALLYLLGDLDISPLTLTCAAPGDGYRLGIDRDGDGILDGDERDRGTDAADPRSPGQLRHP